MATKAQRHEAHSMRMFKFLILPFILLNFAGQVYAAADSAYDLNVNVQSFQLGNGMLFLVVERPATPQVAIRLAIRAGSALEGTGKTGIAHLLEHMLFKGTKNFSPLTIRRIRSCRPGSKRPTRLCLRSKAKGSRIRL